MCASCLMASEGRAHTDTSAVTQAALAVDVKYAAWSKRFTAWLLDIVICGSAFLVLDIVVAVVLTLLISRSDPAGAGVVLGAFSAFGFILVFTAYLAFYHGGESGRTPGKRSTEISVRAASTLGRISYPRALARSCLPALFWALVFLSVPLALGPIAGFAAVLLLLDALWPLRDARHQALHDKVAHTVVVRAPRQSDDEEE